MGGDTTSTTGNQQSLRALIVDDSEEDVLLIIRELKKGGYNPVYQQIETAAAMEKALKDKTWDIILCDYKMPNFSAPAAIALLKKANINIPIIIISGAIGEETAAECMRLGAQDYIMKGNFSRLGPAITRELEETKARDKQKQAEEELRQSEEKYRTILENIHEAYFEVDLAGNITFLNNSFCRITGFSKEELAGANYSKLSDDKETLKNVFQIFNKIYKTGEPAEGFDWPITRKDGSHGYVEASILLEKDSAGNPTGFKGMLRDITERKQSEDALRASEELYTKLVDTIPDIVVRTDLEGKILYVNDYALKISGYRREEIEGRNMLTFIASEDHERLMHETMLMMENKLGPREYSLLIKDGRRILLEINGDVLRNEDGTPFGLVTVSRDISERKRTERALREKEERLRGITQNLPGIIYQFYAKDSGEYGMNYASERLTEFFGITGDVGTLFPLFLSNIHEDDRDRFLTSIKTSVETGDAWNFEGRIAIRSGEMIWFQGLATPTRHEDQIIFDGILLDITERKLAGEKLRERDILFKKLSSNVPGMIFQFQKKPDGTYHVPFSTEGIKDIFGCSPEDVLDDFSPIIRVIVPEDIDKLINSIEYSAKHMTPWQDEYRVQIAGKPVKWVLGNSTPEKLADGSIIWHGFNTDITENKRMNAELQRTLDSLRKSFGATIQVMVSAVEMRDPYTAGHQTRTADIARAIATEMALDQDKIDGIRMAGTIHDIGKLSIPAEILSKPTKLTNLEFSLIKEHPKIGYEMLKDIESPWPLAEIVYQHHERIDGSGYPRKLKGDEILIEARIMAVADVVEAMASHRPYRAALGIEIALEEIEKNKGIFYDNAVADACLKIFRQKGYNIP